MTIEHCADAPEQVHNDVEHVHHDVDRLTRRLYVQHAPRLHCRRGCSSCCVDDLSVFEVEAQHIRIHHAELLTTGVPRAAGACAFLDRDGACRIYSERPYVCRTQGLPLRWVEDDASDQDPRASTETRDICPLNEQGDAIETIPADACWTLGPIEERLARLQLAENPSAPRVRLRDLFSRASAERAADEPPTSLIPGRQR
jgi:hypothetical protein